MACPSSKAGSSLARALPVTPDHHDTPFVLRPYWAAEALNLKEAARIANRSVGTVRTWCAIHFIGRRVGPGGAWQVSRPALQMLLDGDLRTLKDYTGGSRTGPVRHYFDMVGLGHLLSKGGA